jgi:23S rRNA pseudouridine2605 synthase
MNDTPEHTADGDENAEAPSQAQEEVVPKPASRRRAAKPALAAVESAEVPDLPPAAPELATQDVEVAAAPESADEDDEAVEPTGPLVEPAVAAEVFAQVLSGEFDIEPPEEPEAAPRPKRVLRPEPEAPKLRPGSSGFISVGVLSSLTSCNTT